MSGLAEFKPLDLPCGALGQDVQKFDPPGILKFRQSIQNPLLEFFLQFLAGFVIVP